MVCTGCRCWVQDVFKRVNCNVFFFFFDVRILLLNVTMLYFILMINLLIVPFEVIIVVVHRFKTKGYELA